MLLVNLIDLLDIIAAIGNIISIVATLAMCAYSRKFLGVPNAHWLAVLRVTSAKWVWGRNWQSALNWIGFGLLAGVFSYFGTYWFITTSLTYLVILIVLCQVVPRYFYLGN